MKYVRDVLVVLLVLLAGCTLLRIPVVAVFLEFYEKQVDMLSTITVAVFTGFLWRSTDKLWKQAVSQSNDAQASIATSARAATAMERLAANTQTQLRAYLSVNVGINIYQETVDGQDRRFEGQAILLNNGQTPARHVRHQIRAAILPNPLPDNFAAPAYEHGLVGNGVVGPHNHVILTAWVRDMIREMDVPLVKRGQDRALYVWGRVTYDDVFDQAHELTFRYMVLWRPNNSSVGLFTEDYNAST